MVFTINTAIPPQFQQEYHYMSLLFHPTIPATIFPYQGYLFIHSLSFIYLCIYLRILFTSCKVLNWLMSRTLNTSSSSASSVFYPFHMLSSCSVPSVIIFFITSIHFNLCSLISLMLFPFVYNIINC